MLRASLQGTKLVLYLLLWRAPMAETTSLHLRLPKKLYKRLQQQARRNNVSLNTEIVNQLEGYEAATVKRTTEIVEPLLKEAVRAAAETGAEAMLLGIFRPRTEEELLERLEQADASDNF